VSGDLVWGEERGQGPRLVPVHEVAITLEAGGWPQALARRDEIDAHFARRQAANPHLWNGDILLLGEHRLAEGVLAGRARQSDFAAFLWWRDLGWPDLGLINVFALAAIEGADGAFLMGVMGPHTSTAGRIYFPGGTPDLADVTADGRVDLEGSVWRELAEETGLGPADVAHDLGFTAVIDGPRLALLRRLVLTDEAEPARARIRAFLAGDAEPELADMALFRNENDITPQLAASIAPFALAYMRHRWQAGRRGP